MPPTNGLFREEAVAATADRSYGEVLLVRPFSYTFLTAAAALTALSLIVFGFWGEYTRKAHVSGYLAPSKGFVRVYSPQEGIVVARSVQEGQHVVAGDPLFAVSTERNSSQTLEAQVAMIGQMRQRIDSLRTERNKQSTIDEIQNRNLRERIGGLEAELRQSNEEIKTQRRRVASTESTVRRFEHLFESKFVPEILVQQKQEDFLEQQSKLQALEKTALALQRDLSSARLDLSASNPKASNNLATIDRSVLELEQQITDLQSRRRFVVSAPSSGLITTILVDPGQNTIPAQPMLSILPDGAELEAHLFVPARSVGFIKVNQSVYLRYEAYAYQRFGRYRGVVREISKTVIIPGDVSIPVQLKEPAYRVIVRLDSQTVNTYGAAALLQSGMLLDADVLVDSRRIVEWLFDPIYSLTGRL